MKRVPRKNPIYYYEWYIIKKPTSYEERSIDDQERLRLHKNSGNSPEGELLVQAFRVSCPFYYSRSRHKERTKA